MKKLIMICTVLMMVLAVSGIANAATVNFTTSDIKAAIGGLSDASNKWGLWSVRAMPIVGGNGIYTITAGSTSQAGWDVYAPNGAFGNTPYSAMNSVWFADASGSEAGNTAANPLYMIMDVAQDKWWSSAFDASGVWVDDWSPGGGGTLYGSGYDGGFGGTNLITAVADASTFSFDFTLDAGATWNGQWQFVVDGSKYQLGTYASPGAYVDGFFGGYGTGGDLIGNTGDGYMVPEPATVCLLGLGGLSLIRRKRKAQISKQEDIVPV